MFVVCHTRPSYFLPHSFDILIFHILAHFPAVLAYFTVLLTSRIGIFHRLTHQPYWHISPSYSPAVLAYFTVLLTSRIGIFHRLTHQPYWHISPSYSPAVLAYFTVLLTSRIGIFHRLTHQPYWHISPSYSPAVFLTCFTYFESDTVLLHFSKISFAQKCISFAQSLSVTFARIFCTSSLARCWYFVICLWLEFVEVECSACNCFCICHL